MFNVANIKLHFSVHEIYLYCSFSGITCQRPTVRPPLQIATGLNKQTFNYNDSIVFRCEEGYNLNGTAVQQCTQNEYFQQNLPTCLRTYFISILKGRWVLNK